MIDDRKATRSPWTNVAFAVSGIAAVAFVVCSEWSRWQDSQNAGQGIGVWLSDMQLDSTPFAVLFLSLPVFLLIRTPIRLPQRILRPAVNWFGSQTKPENSGRFLDTIRAAVLAMIVGGASLAASLHVAFQPVNVGERTYRLSELPPSFQDEFSYLFQARTILDGRWSYPGHPSQPRLFDSMHIYNEGRVASRYLPGTGIWIATFERLNHPYWGHWLAGALSAMFVFAAGRELGGNGVGFLAGLLTAVSPGMALFSNLLLAHHPTTLGLTLFLWMFLRMMRTGTAWNACLAGLGLSFAMLCRPMTAFGFGLPFGVVFFIRVLRQRGDDITPRLFRSRMIAAIGLPFVLAFIVIGLQNRAITGNWLSMPYSEFTNTYTPRHVFGFDNGERAEAKVAAGTARTNDVFIRYDRWAANLTSELAAENVVSRLAASARWTLGIVPLLMAAVVFLLHRHRDELRWWLIPAAVVSLHCVHIPYWFDGMLHYHYVFETGPLLLLIFARATQLLFVHAPRVTSEHLSNDSAPKMKERKRPLVVAWWGLVAVVALFSAYFPLDPFWKSPRVDGPLTEYAFSKRRYLQANQLLQKRIPQEDRPALVLIEPDETQFHFEYITNDPDQRRERILRGRFRPGLTSIADVIKAFPNRSVYLWRMRTGEYRRLAERRSQKAPQKNDEGGRVSSGAHGPVE